MLDRAAESGRSGIRAIAGNVDFGSELPEDDRPISRVAPEILAFALGAFISLVAAAVGLLVGEPGAAIVMVAPLITALFGLAFIAYTSRQ